jgi:ABC-type Zn uptake system ZnuABC Zn-binding protein ZnuA
MQDAFREAASPPQRTASLRDVGSLLLPIKLVIYLRLFTPDRTRKSLFYPFVMLHRSLTAVLSLAIVVALGACSDSSDTSDDAATSAPASDSTTASAENKPKPAPLVIGLNYAIANIAYQLGGYDAKVVYPIPVETDPARWQPEGSKILAMRDARLFLYAENEQPPWLEKLADQTDGTLVALPVEGEFSIGFHPTQAIALCNSIEEQLTALFDDPLAKQRIAQRSAALIKKLKDHEMRWRTAGVRLRQSHLAAESDDFENWAAAYGAPLVLIERRDQLTDKGPRVLLVPDQPGTLLKSEMKVRGVQVAGLDSGRSRPAQGDLLTLMEKNLTTLSAFVDPESTAQPTAIASTRPRPSTSPDTLALGKGFDGTMVPLLEKYCLECHDAETGEGEVDFEVYLTETAAVREPELWESVANLLEMQEMPPRKKKTQPSDAERAAMIAWIGELSERWDQGEMGQHPGHTTIRRLNKNEYNYTIRDLFSMRLRPADNFPEDGGGEAGFDNNSDALFLPSLLMENYVESAGLIVQSIYSQREARARYLFVQPSQELSAQKAARQILKHWSTRAYRRPVADDELQRLISIFQRQTKSGKNFVTAMQMPLLAILISPNFLYRSETERPDRKPYPVEGFDLADRLSYFLWSSMPDDALAQAARDGSLSNEKVLAAQVDRMLDDPKANSLSLHFAGQWFGWEELRSRANPDETRYPTFTFDLRVAMYQESSNFFGHLISTNASVFDLLDCDYTFLNEQLARHYRIPGVVGPQLRKVTLTDPNRGGVLGMASVLTATSLPLRSSPAARGSYVLTELLGTPPPEPPMNVEQLPDDDRELEAKTFREALVQHREDINCKACHETIDPIGFGLESFDAIGRWRTEQNGQPLDSAGTMPDGTEFQSPADLKKVLLMNREKFARTFAEKLLSYALGRELSPYDRPSVRKITDRVIADNGSIRTAFLEVATSYPFRYRANVGTPPVPASR